MFLLYSTDPGPLDLTLYNHNEVVTSIAQMTGTAYTDEWKKEQAPEEVKCVKGKKQSFRKSIRKVEKKSKVIKQSKVYCTECSKLVDFTDFPTLNFPSKSAQLYGLQTAEELARLERYLFMNGKYGLIPVQMRGACMFAAFRKCIKCPEGFTNTHLRRHLIMELVKNKEYFSILLKEHILEEYGSSEDGLGPFSYQTYLQYMLKRDSWGDHAMLIAMSNILGVRITVVSGESLSQTKIGHGRSLEVADVVLVYCGNNHYSAAVKPHSGGGDSVLEVNVPKGDSYSYAEESLEVYSDEEDADVKSLVIGIKNSFAENKISSSGETTAKSSSATDESTVLDSSTLSQYPTTLGNQKVSKYWCDDCQRMFSTGWGLTHHRFNIHKEGEGYACLVCGKIYATKGLLKKHSLGHLSESDRIKAGLQCICCHQVFRSKRNLKAHLGRCIQKYTKM